MFKGFNPLLKFIFPMRDEGDVAAAIHEALHTQPLEVYFPGYMEYVLTFSMLLPRRVQDWFERNCMSRGFKTVITRDNQ